MKKWVTLEKMGHSWKDESHLEKCGTLRKSVNLKKWLTLGNIGDTCKSGSHLEKSVNFAKMGNS